MQKSLCIGAFMLPVVLLSASVTAQVVVTNTTPYFENFESGPGAWTQTGGIWVLGTPAKTLLNGAASGTNAWVTRLTTNYPNNTNVTVQASFDFSALTGDPVFSFKLAYAMEPFFDGAVIEVNRGFGFQRLGTFMEGINWYDLMNVVALANGPGWSNSNQSTYRTAQITIPNVAGNPNVVIRVRFASDSSVTGDGVAFDDVAIIPPAPPPFQGTGEGLLAFGIHQGNVIGTDAGTVDVINVQPGDFVEMTFAPFLANGPGAPFGILATYFDFTSSTVPEVTFPAALVSMFPGLAMSRLYADTFGVNQTSIILGTDAGTPALGVPPLMPVDGINISFFIPPVIGGNDILFQAVILGPTFNNGFFATSNGLVING